MVSVSFMCCYSQWFKIDIGSYSWYPQSLDEPDAFINKSSAVFVLLLTFPIKLQLYVKFVSVTSKLLVILFCWLVALWPWVTGIEIKTF